MNWEEYKNEVKYDTLSPGQKDIERARYYTRRLDEGATLKDIKAEIEPVKEDLGNSRI